MRPVSKTIKTSTNAIEIFYLRLSFFSDSESDDEDLKENFAEKNNDNKIEIKKIFPGTKQTPN